MTTTSDIYYGTGRRKGAVARVWLSPGSGQVVINERGIDDYFPRATNRMVTVQPLSLTEQNNKFNVKATVHGGGHSGQAAAIRHGLSRALCLAQADLRATLKKAGYLTRDARIKERKKYGQPGARKRYQFSKR
jgi:small subunit ribosomal protein S9